MRTAPTSFKRGVMGSASLGRALQKGASFALRELRVKRKGRPIRVFYAFDPARSAVLLIGGEKKGQPRFYERMIRQSERLWSEYLSSYSR